EMEGKSSGGSKQTLAKNLDVPVTKGELEEARKAAEETKKKKKANEEVERRRKQWKIREDSDPVIVTNWLRVIEDIFEISECSHRQRVKYASHLLKGEARHWWNMIKIARGEDVASVMTWKEFEDLVMENYCPQGLMDKLEEEFLKLQQNDMTVPKYTTKFHEKARFAKYQENNRQLEEGGDNKRKRENRYDDVKKIKTNSGKMEIVGEYKPCTICKKTYKGECWHDNCQNCGKLGHTSKECKDEWVCFKCKSPGHKIVDCPERKPHDTQSQKTMGRVFQLTAKNT
ncbi:zinc finger, CCHC-type, retrotransposon gag domain protein, partial [Tanacetum coccineum]